MTFTHKILNKGVHSTPRSYYIELVGGAALLPRTLSVMDARVVKRVSHDENEKEIGGKHESVNYPLLAWRPMVQMLP